MKRAQSVIIGIMLMTTLFAGLFLAETASAADIAVPGTHAQIQDAINASSAGDTIIVQDGYYVQDLVINKSVTIRSANGSATTWINGTVNITVDNVIFGQSAQGFTVYQATINQVNTHTINISTNASRDNITIEACTITGGYDGVHVGMTAGTANETSNLTIYNCIINGNGRSAIYAGPGQLVTANFSLVRAHNTSNTIYGDIIWIDGGNDVLIYGCTLYNSLTNGGMGINSSGASNVLTACVISKNTIYNVYPYSPICITSQASAASVANMRIVFNELENNSLYFAEPAIRFDNRSGNITATNISVMFNNINTTGNDIEEQYGGTVATFKNWTGIMPAYFNWYGTDVNGSFRNSGHQYGTPRLQCGAAAGDAWTNTDYVEISGASTGTINATANADVLLGTVTTTDSVVMIVYPYGLGAAFNPLDTIYPIRAMHNYKEIGVSVPGNIDFPVNITVYYDAADLAIRGWSENRIRGLAFYNETSNAWEEFNDTGTNTDYSGQSYSGFVWANAYTTAQITGAVVCINFNEIAAESGAASGDTTTEETTATVTPAVPWTFAGLGVIQWVVIIAATAIVLLGAAYAYTVTIGKGAKRKGKKKR